MRTLSFAIALSCIVLQAPARADNACLTGDSTLSDQRSLASLADTTDGACPCAAATSGRSYQRCARDVLRAQLIAATVRPECEKTARLDLRGTACGTAKVAAARRRSRATGRHCAASRDPRRAGTLAVSTADSTSISSPSAIRA